jgi:uncharacterized protein (DUF2267 family)
MDTGYSTFNSTVHKTNRVLRDIEEDYGWRKELREQSYSALRAVLHALRDRLMVQEAADFAAQLPILVRGVFHGGWDPSRVPVKMHKEQFLERIRRDLSFELPDDDVERCVRVVLSALGRFVTAGELEDIRAVMPRDIGVLVP